MIGGFARGGDESIVMDYRWTERPQLVGRPVVTNAARGLATTSALLLLDGQLGPVSFALRRAAALTALAVLVVSRLARTGPAAASETSGSEGGVPLSEGGSDGAAPSRCPDERTSMPGNVLGWRIAEWAAVLAAIVIVAQAPSVPVALLGLVIGMAAIEGGVGARVSSDLRAAGFVAACLSYLALRFVVDLVPQAGWIAGAVAGGGSRYVDRIRGSGAPMSFTSMGGPAVGLAVLYLLWGWRRAGGIGRIVAAVIIPLAWFALLPIATPEVSSGPVAAFSRGAYHGLFWLGVAGVMGTFGGLFSAGPSPSASDDVDTSPTRQRGSGGPVPPTGAFHLDVGDTQAEAVVRWSQ